MAAPKKPNTVKATAARMRPVDDRWAERLRAHGFVVIAPEALEEMNPELADMVRRLGRAPGGVPGRGGS